MRRKGHQHLCSGTHLSLQSPAEANATPAGGTSPASPPRSSQTPRFAPFLPLRRAGAPRTAGPPAPALPSGSGRAAAPAAGPAASGRPVTSGSCHTDTAGSGAAPSAPPAPALAPRDTARLCRRGSPRSLSSPLPQGKPQPPTPPGHGLPDEAAPASWRPEGATHRPPPTLRGTPSPEPGRGPPSPRNPPPVSAAPALAPRPLTAHRELRAPPLRAAPRGEGVAVPRQRAARPERRPAQEPPSLTYFPPGLPPNGAPLTYFPANGTLLRPRTGRARPPTGERLPGGLAQWPASKRATPALLNGS